METLTYMPRFTKINLQYHYQWPGRTTIITPTYKDDDLIDVANGDDVLNFINRFFVVHNLMSHNTFERIEFLLKHHLPMNINTRRDITAWVKKNWDRQFYN